MLDGARLSESPSGRPETLAYNLALKGDQSTHKFDINFKIFHDFRIKYVMVKQNLCTNIMYKFCVNYAMNLCWDHTKFYMILA